MNRRSIVRLSLACATLALLAALPFVARPQASTSSLPDVGGFHVGGTVPQIESQLMAYDKLGRVFPANMVDPYFGKTPLPYALLFAEGVGASEMIRADLTSPPDAQVVWRITRTLTFPAGKQPLANDMLAALRQKYGPESIDMRTNPVRPYWFYDESGQRAKDGNGVSLQNCLNVGPPSDGGWNALVLDGGGVLDMTLPPDPWQGLLQGCGNMVTLSAVLSVTPGTSSVTVLTVSIADYPLAAREYQKTKALVSGGPPR